MDKNVETEVKDSINEEFAKRCKEAEGKIALILEKNKLGISAQLDITINGVTPKVVYVDLNNN